MEKKCPLCGGNLELKEDEDEKYECEDCNAEVDEDDI